MVQVTLVLADGSQRSLDAAPGTHLMAAASQAGIPGITAECGGAMMCATCHVYVDDAWIERLAPPQADELDMLDGTAAQRLPGSRLSCQIVLDAALDGLCVRVPNQQ